MTEETGKGARESLREALHAAVAMADRVIETQSLTTPLDLGEVVAIQIPAEEWGALCSAIREVLNRG